MNERSKMNAGIGEEVKMQFDGEPAPKGFISAIVS